MGFRKGLLLEIVSLLSLIIGVIGGLKLLNVAIPVLQRYLGDVYGLLPFLTFLIVFALIIGAVKLIGISLKKVIGLTPLGVFDNVLGAGIGALKWCMAVGLLLYVSNFAGVTVVESAAKTSVMYPYVVKVTPLTLDLIGLALPFAKSLLSVLKELF